MSDNQVGFRFTKDNKNASEEVKNRAREMADSFVAKTLEKQKEREAAAVARKNTEIEASREALRVALVKEADQVAWAEKHRVGFGGRFSIVMVIVLAFLACDWTYSLRETTGHQMLTVRAIKAIPGLFKNNTADNTTMPVSEDGK